MAAVLFAPTLSTEGSSAARLWVAAVCRALRDIGHAVTLLPSAPPSAAVEETLGELGVSLLPPAVQQQGPDAVRLAPRLHARRIVTHARDTAADWTLVQGAELVDAVARGGALARTLWAVPLDAPYRTELLDERLLDRLEGIGAGVHRLLVVSEGQRAVFEALHAGLASRVGLLPTLSPGAPAAAFAPGADLEIDLDFFTAASLPSLSAYQERTRALRHVPRVLLTGEPEAPTAEDPRWIRLAGRQLGAVPGGAPAAYGLVPTTADPAGRATAIEHYLHRGIRPVALREPDEARPEHDHPGLTVLSSSADLVVPAEEREAAGRPDPSPLSDAPSPRLPAWFPHPRAHAPLSPAPGRPLRVVLAGSDFKFAGDLIRGLAAHPDVDLRIDVFKHHNHPQPEISRPYLEWADVVIAEFAVRNAIWYSQHLRPDQKLIVRLHGFELLSTFIDDLRVDRCSAILVPSEAYREQALAMKGWPAAVVRAMPNSVDRDDLYREKLPDARFHLGLAGYVPILKRPERALDLLRLLREQDPRYVLHLRGNNPFDYSYEWAKAGHQDAYRLFYERIGADPLLRDGVSFEPFAPDMGNWLRRIGWMLSPSVRETFHMAGVEGAASGAVPLVWDRAGAREIFGDEWTFEDTESIASFVLEANRSEAGYAAVAARAATVADPYETHVVLDRWVELLRELTAGADAAPVPAVEDEFLADVQDALRDGSYIRALEALDANSSLAAASAGPLKDAEMWVRGVAALDSRRFGLLLPGPRARHAAEGAPLTVRSVGQSSTRLALDGLERWTIDLAPHAFTDPRDAPLDPVADDIQPDRGMAVSDLGGPARADRWVEAHAGRIAAEARRTGRTRLLACGPWWVALPAALAADRLGLTATWIVTDPADVARAERALAAPDSDEPLDHVVLRAFAGMDGIVDETGLLSGSPLAAELSLAATPTAAPAAGAPVSRPWARLDYPGRPAAVQRDPADLHVLLAGGQDLADAWAAAGARVTRLSPADLTAPVAPSTDLVVLDLALLEDPAWEPGLTGADATAHAALGRVVAGARSLGARSVALGHRAGERFDEVLPLLRRHDVVTTPTPALAAPLLTGAPTVVERVLPVAAVEVWPADLLRWAGLSVPLEAPAASAPATARAAALDAPEEPAAQAGPRDGDNVPVPVEGVSVVLATHRGADRIQGMLDSLAGQSLPSHLLELVVVENGGSPDSEAAVSRFAAQTGIPTIYRFLAEPGVGGARNVGIAAASREYVTFVDDDDLLDPDYLLSMWLSASPTDVVFGTMHDLGPDGTRDEQTHTARRLAALRGGRRLLGRHGGALSMNACKLIPRDVAVDCRYPEDLSSGEDVVFMAQLLGRGLHLSPAAPMPKAAYLRVLRPASVSRRDLTFDFAVRERLAVLRHLRTVSATLTDPHDLGSIRLLMRGQAGFVSRYRAAHPDEHDRVDSAIIEAGLEDVAELR